MIRKTLIAGFACVSMFAVAQSASTNSNSQSASTPASVHNSASGQASGKTEQKATNREASRPSVSDAGVSAPSSGQNMSGNHKDGWNVVKTDSGSGNDGGKGSQSSATYTNGGKTMQDSWDAKGMVKSTGPGGTQTAVGDVNQDGATDRANPASNGNGQARVATGDVNGDGRPDVTGAVSGSGNSQDPKAKTSKVPATGQPSSKKPLIPKL